MRNFEQDAALLAAIADPVRLRLLHKITENGSVCVCDLRGDPPIPANLLSYHLRILREAELITGTRRGRWIDYALTPDALEKLHATVPAPPAQGAPKASKKASQVKQDHHETNR